MIQEKDFLKNFATQFEETPVEEFEMNTCFRDLDEWDSMTALTIIAMIDEEYQVKISPEEMKKSNTIKNLYDIVKAKK